MRVIAVALGCLQAPNEQHATHQRSNSQGIAEKPPTSPFSRAFSVLVFVALLSCFSSLLNSWVADYEDPSQLIGPGVAQQASEFGLVMPRSGGAVQVVHTRYVMSYSIPLYSPAHLSGLTHESARCSCRFQQKHPKLHVLGHAHMQLFTTFCLPSMINQGSQDFIWLIQTDPNLSAGLMSELKRLVAPYPNFYLIRLESDEKRPDLRLPALLNVTAVESGDQALLKRSIRDAKSNVYIETHLDADDGLSSNMLQRLREEVIQRLGPKNNFQPKDGWLVQCIHNNVAWHPAQPGDADQSGLLKVDESKDFCPSPGFSKAFAPGTTRTEATRIKRSIIAKEVGRCNSPDATACLHGIDQAFGAVRAHATSFGSMSSVGDDHGDNHKTEFMWSQLRNHFNINRLDAIRTGRYFNAIAREVQQATQLGGATTKFEGAVQVVHTRYVFCSRKSMRLVCFSTSTQVTLSVLRSL